MNFKDAEKMILEDGWYFTKQKGSHHHYKHPIKPGKVSIPDHGHRDIHPDTIQSIKRQAGLK